MYRRRTGRVKKIVGKWGVFMSRILKQAAADIAASFTKYNLWKGGGGGTGGNVYSTKETVVGTWIDGRNIYRKVFVGSSGTYDVAYLNIDALIRLEAYGTYSGGYKMCLTSTSGINGREMYVKNNTLTINHISFDIQHVIIEYVKVES